MHTRMHAKYINSHLHHNYEDEAQVVLINTTQTGILETKLLITSYFRQL